MTKRKTTVHMSEMVTNLLNAVHKEKGGVIVSYKNMLKLYGIAPVSYYRLLSFLKSFDFINIIWDTPKSVSIELKKNLNNDKIKR